MLSGTVALSEPTERLKVNIKHLKKLPYICIYITSLYFLGNINNFLYIICIYFVRQNGTYAITTEPSLGLTLVQFHCTSSADFLGDQVKGHR